jgi:hypothetical protein
MKGSLGEIGYVDTCASEGTLGTVDLVQGFGRLFVFGICLDTLDEVHARDYLCK